MAEPPRATNFIRQIIERDIAGGRLAGPVITRFPPEPNGYLHIGHAKSICLNFGIARDYGGLCSLRFDDTNPHRENQEYVDSIIEDVRWLGFDWGDRLYFASDYFERLFEFAVELTEAGKAFVCDQSPDEVRSWRGTLTEPGRPSPNRDRSVSENLDLFRRMRAGEFEDGARTLRARIDMASPNLNLRDPVLYRIKRGAIHHHTGESWCIYPTYDYTHPLSDALEGVTHSLCTLEFEDHRPLYDWVVDNVSAPSRPRQIEFSRLSLDYTVMSKRLLTLLVSESHVDGWDDPRMPTINGMRRRGYTPAAIRSFCDRVGVTKNDQHIELGFLENCVREDLDRAAPRAMAVLDPLRVVIENYPESAVEDFEAANHPNDPALGTRRIPFCREILIERDDFMEDPPPKFFRLAPGREVRLRYAYLVTCTGVVRDDRGTVVELRCRYDPDSRGGSSPDGRKVRGTLHWVSARHAPSARVRLYDRLFRVADPTRDRKVDFRSQLNPESLKVAESCRIEPALAEAAPGGRFQFERLGYFCVDRDSTPDHPLFNRTVTLRDSWGEGAAAAMKLRDGEPWMTPAAYGRSLAGLTVNLLVRDIAAAVAFQTSVLDARVVYADADFAVLRACGAEWMLHADHTYRDHPMHGVVATLESRGMGVELRLHGCDPDRAEAAARQHGHVVLQGAMDKPHGLREAFLVDPDGYVWVADRPLP